ncbi:MAG: Ppx/GppA family phosphatase [Deltaproteobacteria bacterium]|nr:Ppx/GppA family phosphatase [Nannocystaceae bacterium]
MRAVIDIGTNTVLLLIAERRADGSVHVVEDHARIARLGQGVAQSGRLLPEAIARTVAVLAEYRDVAAKHHAEIVAVATEGLRMAGDPTPFLEPAQRTLGAPIRLISGDEEAELSYRSVASESAGGPLRVLDIGGASTELVVGDGVHIGARRSHPIGSVRLTERFVHHDPPSPEEIAAIEDTAMLAFSSEPLPPHPELHGLAGTVTCAGALLLGLTAYDRERVDGSRFALAEIVGLRDQLAAATLAERLAMPVLGTGRADVIVAGMTILVAALRHCGADTLVVRDRGLRFALV